MPEIEITALYPYNKIYYGPSVGVGCISKSRKDNKNYWHFELLVPFRSSQFTSDLAALKNNPAIQGVTDPLPVAISIGYHFVF